MGTERITVAKMSTSQTHLSSQACSIKFTMVLFYRNSDKSHRSLCTNNDLEQLKLFKKGEQIEVLKLQCSGNMTKSSKSQ